MQYCDRIDQYRRELQERENEFLSIKAIPCPSQEKIQKLIQDIQSVSAEEERLVNLIMLNTQEKLSLATLDANIKSLNKACKKNEKEIQENLTLISKAKEEIAETNSAIEKDNIEQQEINSIIAELTEEISELTEKILPKRNKLDVLRADFESLKSQHSSLFSLLSSLTDSEQHSILEIQIEESDLERLAKETEKLIHEKHLLQSKKNELKSFESLNSASIIMPKPRQTNTDTCSVCSYPKVGRVKVCKQCNLVVHQKCMLNSECFNCNMPNK